MRSPKHSGSPNSRREFKGPSYAGANVAAIRTKSDSADETATDTADRQDLLKLPSIPSP